ncbi:trypsin-like peptidase domain-containing protein [Candidatus Nomurabacteria bacterium]|nr:trypsin-like peptidase domain-containing protein [Candidatus Nomurabacteria bacterium]MCB9818014.1 trypsin-like peptidase domain-containing protein [Candidatus Nomurabacteria bacterium]
MFCEKCGEKLNEEDKFCIHCGETVSENESIPLTNAPIQTTSSPTAPFPVAKYLLAVFAIGMISFVGYMLLNNGSYDTSSDGSSSDEEEYVTALNELGPLMEPIGYFDDVSLMNADINADEWFSHIKYLDVEQTPVTDENRTYASVVKIVCEDDDYIYYGSGTNLDSAGYVLTNYHVVEGLPEDACMVGFPDPKSGLIREAYWTTIITDKADETGHDLAYLAIERPIFDEEGNLYGYYDKVANGTFPYFEHTDECLSTETQLGGELLILGYPPLSGGSLTITNGLVSSLYSQDGYIVTSAKIVSGNSGGLAVDSNGCYVGVPTAVYYDDEDVNQELFGEIIDAEFVFDFDLAVEDDLQEYYEKNDIVETPNLVSENIDDGRADTVPTKTIVLEVPGALRSCASTDCEVIRYYAEGASVELIGQSGSWYKVQARDDYGSLVNGYIHQSIFEKDTEPETVTNDKTTSEIEIGDGEIIVSDQPAGTTIKIDNATYPISEGWLAVREYVDGELRYLLGAVRFSESQGLVPSEILLQRQTNAGEEYAIVIFTENGDFNFDLSDDVQIEQIYDTFEAY